MDDEFDVEFIDRDDREARFLVRGANPAFANSLRRAMLADVPTMAIDSIRVIENSSVMFNEQIALRLGLVPLSTPLGEFEEGDVVTLALDVEGPGVAYSGDLESSDDLVTPTEENIPIIELKEDQRLEVEADAVLDVGREHAKHQGGVAIGYRHLQRVEALEDRGEFEDEEPQILRGVIEEDGELVPSEDFDHDLTNRYPGKRLEVHDVPEAFVFHVETDGSIEVADLVERGAQSLVERADELETGIQL